MKKTSITLFTLIGVVSADTITISPDIAVTLDTNKVYRLDFDCRAEGASHSFEVITTGNQTITGTDGYTLDDLATSTISFTLGGKLTADGSYNKFGNKFKNGVTINMNMGINGSFYSSNGGITLVGYDSKLNLTTETDLNLCSTGISTRELISLGMEESAQGSIWYSVNGTSTSLTLKDATLEAAGYTYAGVLCLQQNGTYTDLAGNAITLGENEYGMLFTRKDYSYNNNATESVSLIINKAIPEPATATLSMLALAGLAGHRRRR